MSNDTLNVVLSVGGILIGMVVSWAFFRAQQQTDFNKLRDSLTEISKSVAILNDANRLSERIDLVKDLSGLRASVESLNRYINQLSSTILNDFRHQQRVFMKSVQEDFEIQIEQSRKVLEGSIEKELKNLIPSSPEQRGIIIRLVDLVKHALHSMGEFQRAIIENQSETALRKVATNVVSAIDEASKEAQQVKKQVETLPMLLPPQR
jgi:uncharacterized phage infection (PIP) family protein YhgE